jgi:hypothetical protein
MESLNQLELEKALVDVRKAYRLLYTYQRRVMDLMQFIGGSFDFKFGGGWPWFSGHPLKEQKVSLDKWSWDWLNMYFYEFSFTEKEVNGTRLTFSVLAEADTGYYDAQCDTATDINGFGSVEDAQTQLIFFAGLGCAWTDFREDVDDKPFPLFTANAPEFIRTNDNGIFVAKIFPLARFLNQEETLKCLTEWQEFCETSGVKGMTLA